MGLLDVVPGMGEAKTMVGMAVGGVVGYFSGKYAAAQEIRHLKTQYRDLEEEVHDLRKRLGIVDEIRLQRALLKIAILRQLAWKDDVLDPREQLFLHQFVLQHPDLPADYKIQVMCEIREKPSMVAKFWQYIDVNYRTQLYGSEEEKLGFKTVLLQLAYIDGEFDKSEQIFVDSVLKACGLSIE
jgi:tellurite resistance protein